MMTDAFNMMTKLVQNMPSAMKHTSFWLGICLFYAIIKSALTIDCYECTSQNGDHKECEDTFQRDVSTYSLISRNCFYGYWRAKFCIKLKGTRALTIDCYECTSQNGDHKECEDTFQRDVSTYSLISRNCFYGYWRAKFCIKLKGTRADGSSIMVRQCTVKNWGSHCGLIQFESSKGLEDVDGCLESCDFDGCNTATTYRHNYCVLFTSVIIALSVWLWNRR